MHSRALPWCFLLPSSIATPYAVNVAQESRVSIGAESRDDAIGAGQGWMLGRGSELQAGRAVVHSGVLGAWLCKGFYIKERSYIKALPSGSHERYRLPKALGALTYFVTRPRSL